MNFEYLIAKKIIYSQYRSKDNISSPIIKIAITAITIGIIVILFAISTGKGLQQKIREKISAFNGHIQITNYDANFSDVSINPISTKQDFYPFFKEVPEITHIQKVATKGGIIRTNKTFEGIIAKGVAEDYDWKYLKQFITQGQIPNYNQKNISNQIIISEYIANRLNLKIGDKCNTIFLNQQNEKKPFQRNFDIVAIYNSGYAEFDASYIFTDIRQIQKMNKWNQDQIGNFEIFINDFANIKDAVNKVYKNTPPFTDTHNIVDKYSFVFEWLQMFDFNILLVITIMILVGGINIITMLLVMILERTPMIGTLKAIGTQNKSIRKIFLYCGAFILLRGLIYGNIIAIILMIIQKYLHIVKLNPDIYYVTEVPVYMSIPMFLITTSAVLIICTAMMIIPSLVIKRIKPIKIIKFE